MIQFIFLILCPYHDLEDGKLVVEFSMIDVPWFGLGQWVGLEEYEPVNDPKLIRFDSSPWWVDRTWIRKPWQKLDSSWVWDMASSNLTQTKSKPIELNTWPTQLIQRDPNLDYAQMGGLNSGSGWVGSRAYVPELPRSDRTSSNFTAGFSCLSDVILYIFLNVILIVRRSHRFFLGFQIKEMKIFSFIFTNLNNLFFNKIFFMKNLTQSFFINNIE